MKVETETVLVNLRNVQKYRLTAGFWFSAFSDCSVGKDGRSRLLPVVLPLLPPEPTDQAVHWFAGAEFFSEDITDGPQL